MVVLKNHQEEKFNQHERKIFDELQRRQQAFIGVENGMRIFKKYLWMPIIIGIILSMVVDVSLGRPHDPTHISWYVVMPVAIYVAISLWWLCVCFYPWSISRSYRERYLAKWKNSHEKHLREEEDRLEQKLIVWNEEKQELEVMKKMLSDCF
jgi:hypothetical protein